MEVNQCLNVFNTAFCVLSLVWLGGYLRPSLKVKAGSL